MVIDSLSDSALRSSQRLRQPTVVEIRNRIDDLLTDIRPCTLRDLDIFGRGFMPKTSSVNVSGFLGGTQTYKDVLINNLSPDCYHQFLTQLALIFGCSAEKLKAMGYFCYNVARGYNRREDVPAVSFQMGIADDGYVQAIGNQE